MIICVDEAFVIPKSVKHALSAARGFALGHHAGGLYLSVLHFITIMQSMLWVQ
jgi:hypothetical protein